MSAPNFQPGDTAYTADGRTFEYVCETLDGHILRPLLDCGDGYEPSIGDPELHRQVFATTPTDRYAADVAETLAKLKAAREESAIVGDELAKLKRERAALLESFAKHPDLQPIADYLAGTITHVATLPIYAGHGRIAIKTLADALKSEDRDGSDSYHGKVRCLSLYGGYAGAKGARGYSDDPWEWQLSGYSDGSGSLTPCVLGTSEENVKQRLQILLDRELKKHDVTDLKVSWANDAVNLGLSVPERYQTIIANRRADAAEREERKARDAVTYAEKQLAQAKAAAATFEAKA